MPEEIRIGDYRLHVKGRLAEGGFGVVDLVTDVATRSEYVLKRCSVQREEFMETVKKEVHLLQVFESPNIVKLLGNEYTTTKNHTREALILLEYCPGG